jgi:nicotinate-nucleotide adenylyltransferase
MKIGLLGGSFNPIHQGHLKIAETVAEQLNLAEIWFVPTAYHPLKNQSQLLAFEKRVELISKAIEPFAKFKLSLMDADKTSRNYTYDLFKKIKTKNPSLEPVFIVGSDIMAEITKWYKYTWLLQNVTFAVIKRPGRIIDQQSIKQQFKSLITVTMEPVSVSSTEIREKIKKDQSIYGLVPAAIEATVLKYYKEL